MMAEPFKNELGEARIRIISSHLVRVHKDFNADEFLSIALKDLNDLSLMQRNAQIVEAMAACLPTPFPQAKEILMQALAPYDQQLDEQGLHSWLAVPVSEFLGKHGKEHFNEAMQGLAQVTPLFSSEWGIRHIIDHQQENALKILHQWTKHKNEHVRRLVSEGSRPRLPWGFQLKAVVNDPDLTFPLLEKLKNDPSDYVRLSVSNHLNDISKDHPDYLQKKIEPWLEPSNAQRTRLIKHACRTLIKQGHQPTLNMLGFKPFKINNIKLELQQNTIKYGEKLNFNLSFDGPDSGRDMIIDYAIHFQKANGSLAAKVFKWKVTSLNKDASFKGKKAHAIKPVTTRKYYNGEHLLEVLVNGKSIATQPFLLEGVF